MDRKKTAAYSTIAEDGGNRYQFYCGVSGACVCTKQAYHADMPEEELMAAWENEGKVWFNLCHKCGKWVIAAVYNPEVFECTDCAPFEYETHYCKSCGAKVADDIRFCPVCHRKLHYEGD